MFIETRELPVTEPVKVGRYSALAEAIRRGAKTVPAARGGTFFYDHTEEPCGACVLGTALFGVGIKKLCFEDDVFINNKMMVSRTFGVTREFAAEIESRFEYLKQTREAIADWLDSL